ncbi:MAG: ABC transporter ATP-binding protein/permease [Clostridiales bacterium]|jgi:putative ABC transport system permease protein|nr:ABC transporter ATP-binding protein/permease [Clostridiales bacterium]
MLELKGITKIYETGEDPVHALKGVDIKFRKSEFVSTLGPSGCGKTTMLNIIGGLDRYTEGDLVINGVSTKEYKDRDWDTYRNHSVGFVFQSYNLIPHQTVLENVELALTLAGVGKAERRRRATEVLHKVGLSDKLRSRPNQLSGGQMQRVAIARALINDPEILLADEPTGALDTKTSDQIMDLLKEISNDRLIIMVTHNPELAEKYSTRIIKLLDGAITDDSNPFTDEDDAAEKAALREKAATANAAAADFADAADGAKRPSVKAAAKRNKTSMSFWTALSLSLKNLLTKKTRTLLVSFAGSIGIIGIAIILAMSAGFQGYIDKVQEDTLSTYPLTVERTSIDLTGMLEVFMNNNPDTTTHDLDKVYSNDLMVGMFESFSKKMSSNNLGAFKAKIEADETIKQNVNAIQYGYGLPLDVYAYIPDPSTGLRDTNGTPTQVNPNDLFDKVLGDLAAGFNMGDMTIREWSEMLDNQTLLESQYDLVDGSWPSRHDEVVFVMDKQHEIDDYLLFVLGFKDPELLTQKLNHIKNPDKFPDVDLGKTSYTYSEIRNQVFNLVLPYQYYVQSGNTWSDIREYEPMNKKPALKNIVDDSLSVKISGIIKPKETATASSINTTIGYTKALTEYMIAQADAAPVVTAQKATPNTDILSGLPFMDIDSMTMPEIEAVFQSYLLTLPSSDQATYSGYWAGLSDSDKKNMFKSMLNSYDKNMSAFGTADINNPTSISFYPKNFESKDAIINFIKEYNASMEADGHPENVISYTDFIGLMMSSISTIINAITYVLIGFVSVSLVVSSIMIGIITYISVLERIKEIGILRAVGASKRDVSRVFTAETLIIGLAAGVMGIIVTLLLIIPINLVIAALTNIRGLAVLPWLGALALIAISTLLTFVAGLIPSRIAAKKDPVEALRNE